MQDLNARLERAKLDSDTAALRKVKEQLKDLKVGKATHRQQDLSNNLAELIHGITTYFMSLVDDDDNMDDLQASISAR